MSAARLTAAGVALAAALACPRAAGAQRVGAGVVTATGLHGVVYDSLIGAPLPGAQVWIEGTTLLVTSDADGRFRFETVPAGSRTIAFAHPALDSLGLPALSRRLVVTPGAADPVELAIPSLATFRDRLCGGADAGLGILVGTVTTAEDGRAVAGARVEVAWVALAWERGRRPDLTRNTLTMRADSAGRFFLCDVPANEYVTIAATVGAAATGALDVLIGPRRLGRQDLRLSLDTTSGAAAAGRSAGRAVVTGTVLDERGTPLPAAQVAVDRTGAEASTDAAGRFVLTGVPAGSRMLMARAIGYGAERVPIHLGASDTLRTSFRLRPFTVLDTIQVTGSRVGALAQVAARMREGWGHFLVGDQIQRHGSVATALHGLPTMSVQINAREVTVLGRVSGHDCNAFIWIDGRRADGSELRTIPPQDLVAVEWYPRANTAPIQFAPPGIGERCGVLVVWTSASRR